MASPLREIRTPGGCDDCDAYQELDQIRPGIYALNVRHDDTCPTYRRMVTQGSRREQS